MDNHLAQPQGKLRNF